MARRRLLRVRYLGPLLLLAAVAVAAAVWFRPGASAMPVTEGEPYVVERGDLEETLFVNGLVKPAVTIDVRTEASGLVEAVHVREGDRVSVGQVLLTLDASVAETAVQEAEASLRQAEMQQTVSELDLDDDTLELRRAELRRQLALHEQGLTTSQAVETAQHQVRQAERAYERAKLSLQSGQARIEQLQAAVERARAELQQATVRSLYDAWVIRRHVEVGSGVAGVSQSTSGGTVLMTLGDATQAELASQVTAADARRLRPGLPVRIRLDSDPDRRVTGQVDQISAAGDVNEQTRLTTFPITISVDTEDDAAWINIPAQAEIVVAVLEDVVIVPDRCLDTNAAGQTTVRRDGGTADAVEVIEVGVISSEFVEVVSGVDAGDTLSCRPAGRPS